MTLHYHFFLMHYLSWIVGLSLALPLQAQFTTVTYDYEQNCFGDHQPLPAEQSLMITGLAPEQVDRVQVLIYNEGAHTRDPLATGSWHRPTTQAAKGTHFKVPIDYPLQTGKRYDILIHYYRPVSPTEATELHQALMQYLTAYVYQVFAVHGKKLRLTQKANEALQDLNDIVRSGLANYYFHTGNGFNGFSNLVYNELKHLQKVKLNKTTTASHEALLKQLCAMLDQELRAVLNHRLSQLIDTRLLERYPVAKRKGYFALNIGYGSVLIEGNFDNLTYGQSAYAGLAFPLATSKLAPTFMRNASLTMGVYFKDFTTATGARVTGPVVGRPLYLGLDYKLFQFVRFNMGAAFLETAQQNGNETTRTVFVQPFVGISAKINISLSLDQ